MPDYQEKEQKSWRANKSLLRFHYLEKALLLNPILFLLIAWAEKEDAFIFPQFCIQEKITMRQFYYLKEAHQEFSEAFSYAKAHLACRMIFKTGKDKEIHPSLSLRYIKYYDEFLYTEVTSKIGFGQRESSRS